MLIRMPDDQVCFFQRLRVCAELSGWMVGGKYHGLCAALSREGITVTLDTVRQWFMGNAIPENTVLIKLAVLLRVSPEWLAKGTGDPLRGVFARDAQSGPVTSRIPVITPEQCYEWCNYLPIPGNLPRLTVHRACHPRTFAYLIRQRKPAGHLRPQRHVIVSPLEMHSPKTDGPRLSVVCDQRKFHIGYIETIANIRFLRYPDHSKPPLRLSFSHQVAGFIDPDTVQHQPVIPPAAALG